MVAVTSGSLTTAWLVFSYVMSSVLTLVSGCDPLCGHIKATILSLDKENVRGLWERDFHFPARRY